MPKEKRSFFERLTGAVHFEDDFDHESAPPSRGGNGRGSVSLPIGSQAPLNPALEHPEEAELSVDVYETPTDIYIKAMVAGVRPEDLDVSIGRDMVSIRGKRVEGSTVSDENYFHKELYWGAFVRTIVLPQEIDTDLAEATEKFGLLSIKLPKVNKDKKAKVKVKSI